MSKPKISIITITFNAEDYIERTLKSVINQTYSNIEYIVIDGASKDNTCQIIDGYKKHISIFVSEPDRNLYDGMNKGIFHATGEYVLMLNAGDCLIRETSLDEIMKGSNGSDFIYSKAICIDETGQRSSWHKTTPLPSLLKAESFAQGMIVCHQCMIVKRNICPDFLINPWKISCDIDWSIRVLKKAKTLHFYDDNFCLYLKDGISAREWKLAVWERIQISAGHFGWFKTIGINIKVGIRYLWKQAMGTWT